MSNEKQQCKQIIVDLNPPPKKKSKDEVYKPPPKKRVVTEDQRWKFSEEELATEYGARIIGILHSGSQKEGEKLDRVEPDHCKLVRQHIINKVGGYKQQDVEKGLYFPEKFIGFSEVLEKLTQEECKCHYCLEPVKIVYEYVRDPKQWTLDRIDNDFGHNRDNVWIACLSCNLRRRTMRPDRYEFTKQMVITKEQK